jgi:uncharacterized membrane protein YdjX (TVP38/TMEM64 family)
MDRVKEIPIKPLIFAVAFAMLTYLGFRILGTEQIRHEVSGAGALGPAIFILLKILTNVLAPLSGAPFYLLAKPLFGMWPGLLYVFSGDVLGYSICFLIARRFGLDFIRGSAGEKAVNRIEHFYASIGGWQGLLYARLFLLGVQDIISYAAGLTSIPFKRYVLVTSIGIIPQLCVAVLIGGTFMESSPILAGIYVLSSIVLPVVWLYYRKQWFRR